MTRSIQRIIDYAALLVVFLAASFMVFAFLNRDDPGTDDGNEPSPQLSAFSVLLTGGHWIGPRDAPAVVLVYSNYSCGFCKQLHESLVTLRHRYPQHLAVHIKHYVQPVRGAELDMALAAECAAPAGAFKDYHMAAFDNAAVTQYRTGWRIVADSANIGNRGAFDECVLSQKFAATVESHYSEATELGIIGTPMLLINGTRVDGAPATAVLDSLIARALDRQ